MKVELAGLHYSPVYGVGLVIDVINQDNFTVLAKGKHWKYEFIVDDDGDKCWYLNGKLHRTDGPAIEYANGTKDWYLNGKCHRTDGPAYEGADGTKCWYLNDKHLSEAQWKALTTA